MVYTGKVQFAGMLRMGLMRPDTILNGLGYVGFGSEPEGLVMCSRMERDIERSTGADAAAPRRWGWRSNAAANLAIVTLCVLARPSQAQTPSPSLQVKIDSQWQMRAEQAWRVLRERRVFTQAGRWIGRVEDVRASPVDGALSASLRLRPLLGGTQFWVPVARFRQAKGKLVVSETVASLRAMKHSGETSPELR